MPKTNKIARFAGGTARAEIPPAQPPHSKLSGLYLLALRSHVAQSYAPIPRRKLTIHLAPKPDADGRPIPIKITLT